jgi:hypothetical protein
MDKIRIDFFDILGYIIPGSALLMLSWIALDNQVHSIWQIYQSIHGVDQKTIFIGLFYSYIVGFILHALGNFIYYQLHRKNKKPITQLSIHDKWTLIREYGEKHIPILERWYALRAFSQNLCAISGICIFLCLYKWHLFGYFEWGLFTFIFIASFIFFMKRSEVFDKFLENDIESVMNKLKLNEK